MSSYTIVSLSQHWRLMHGTYYRDCLVRLSDGALATVAIRDDLLVGV